PVFACPSRFHTQTSRVVAVRLAMNRASRTAAGSRRSSPDSASVPTTTRTILYQGSCGDMTNPPGTHPRCACLSRQLLPRCPPESTPTTPRRARFVARLTPLGQGSDREWPASVNGSRKHPLAELGFQGGFGGERDEAEQ